MSRRFKVIVCRGPECGDRRSSKAVHAALESMVHARGLAAVVEIGWQSCFGRCTQGPNVLVTEVGDRSAAERRFVFATLPAGRPGRSALYNRFTPDDAAEVVEQHIVNGALVRRLIEPIARTARPESGAAAVLAPTTQDPDRSDGDG